MFQQTFNPELIEAQCESESRLKKQLSEYALWEAILVNMPGRLNNAFGLPW